MTYVLAIQATHTGGLAGYNMVNQSSTTGLVNYKIESIKSGQYVAVEFNQALCPLVILTTDRPLA